ncbi:MAG: type II toxin-antitoxin system VapC family toxin [Bacteroidetes bacterium]|nr:type II toxin-antitoxin system VapC family toxin [Bacteroidota bacterium]
MIVIDSSGWLEYFTDGPNADFFAPVVEDAAELIVSSINIYEVFKRLLTVKGEDAALQAVAHMRQGLLVDVDTELAMHAVQLGMAHKLPMADSIILATALRFEAELWTQDADFEGIEGVRYVPKHRN